MDKNHWNTIESILDHVLNLPEEERHDYIRSACEGNTIIFDEVSKMLDAIEVSDETHFLQDLTTENQALLNDLSEKKEEEDLIGRRIGVFEIAEKVGSGGMGGVYRATRADGAFKQQVAIKLIKSGFHSQRTKKRFQMERQILADLSHPHIARLYDGGLTNDGYPYLIMEYIDGMPIDEYCNHHCLSIPKRLRLFKDVCKAVEYAHSNLIIHRDLKAQNIFVDSSGLVKILDFGIAKLLNPKLDVKDVVVTRPGQQIWTPQYAAPEQTDDGTITTATDVYSMGVLLHKLVTNRFPFDFTGKSITQIRATIKNEHPETLSQSLTQADTLGETAYRRGVSASELLKIAKGDLADIVYKAIRRLPEYRYKSVGQLVDDIKNYEINLPVSAKRNSISYRVNTFYRRYKKGILISIGILLVMLGLISYYTLQLSKQKNQAALEAEKAMQISDLLESILLQSSPMARYKPDITLKEVLDQGTEQIKTKLKNQPLAKAELMGLLGNIYTDLGSYSDGKPLLETALTIQDSLHVSDDLLKAENMARFARLLYRQGQFNEAVQYYVGARKILRKIADNTPQLSALDNGLGMVYDEMGQRRKAIGLFKDALKSAEKAGLKDMGTETMGNLAVSYQKEGEFAKSVRLLNQQITRYRQHSSHSIALASALNNLAYTYQRAGELAKADSLHQIALKMREDLLPPDHPHIASSLVRFGLLKIREGQFAKANKMLVRGYNILKKQLPKNHWQVLSAEGALALCRGLSGKEPYAAQKLKKIRDNFSNRFSASDWRTQEANKAYQSLVMMQRKKSLK